MLRAAALLGGAALASATAAPPSSLYSLYYTDAGDCDPPGQPDCKPSEIPALNLKLAKFTRAGALVSNVNVSSQLMNGLGYLALHPSGGTLMFATEDTSPDGIVRTYSLDLTSPRAEPALLLDDLTNLLAPCKPTCVSASTFHATYTPDGSGIVFAYRVWDTYGNGIGNQALASARADGTGIVTLTYTTAGPDGGLNIIDFCPTPVPNDPGRLLFVRTADQGATNYLATVDVRSGGAAAVQLTQLPQYSDTSGCPNYLPTADGLTSMVMLCREDCGFAAGRGAVEEGALAVTRASAGARWGWAPRGKAARRRPSTGEAPPNFYATVTQSLGVPPTAFTFVPLFPVPFVNSTDYDDTYGITQCDAIHGSNATSPITCQGADKEHDTFYRTLVDLQTGHSTGNSYNTVSACMTSRCTVMAETTREG